MLRILDGYYSDSPIESSSDDAFGRDPFAARMAFVIDQMGTQSRSSVAALVGPWGSGKSSILNLLTDHLKTAPTGWRIRRFNPWLFGDIDTLLVNYFSELSAAMPDSSAGKTIRDRLGDYARRVAPLGKIGSAFGFDAASILETVGNLISETKTVADQRDDLVKALSAIDNRVLIVMDDIDRLQPDELLLVLKLIRLIGELPNVHYLLAFDERTLLDVLMGTPIGNNDGSRAAQYIDKMVQIRFDLPPLTDFQEEKIFERGFLKLLDAAGCNISDHEFQRLGTFYREHMQETLRSPRRINKYLAQLSVFLTAEIVRELNVIDFSLLTFIRTFYGTLYSRMPHWKQHLVGGGSSALAWARGRDTRKDRRQEWDRRLQSPGVALEEHDGTLQLLATLFPALSDSIEGGHISGVGAGSLLTTNKHIASAEYFDRYFQFSVPDDDISDALVGSALDYLLDGAEAAPAVAEVLNRMDAEPALVLTKIRLLITGFQCKAPGAMMRVLSDKYKSFDWRDRLFMFSSPQDLARYVAADVLTRSPEQARTQEIDAVATSADLEFSLDLAMTLATSDVRHEAWFTAYKEKLDRRFRAYVDQHYSNLADVQHEHFGLFKTWGQIADDGSARDLAQTRITSGQWDIDQYLAKLTSTSYLVGVSNPIPRLSDLEPSWIELFLGVEFAIWILGNRLDHTPDPVRDIETENPTHDQRLQYALGILHDLKLRRARELNEPVGTDHQE